MLTKIIIALVLACSHPYIQAAETTWNFKYQGFLEVDGDWRPWIPSIWHPDKELTGSFTGEDRNGNGIIEITELTHLVSDGVMLIGHPSGRCMFGTLDVGSCNISNFSYDLTGELAYSVRFGDILGLHGAVLAGTDWTDAVYGRYYQWTEQTTYAISPLAIPEPSIAALLLIGLPFLVTGRIVRRNRSG